MDLLNPSTIHGALLVGIIAGIFSGAIIGFFSGKTYQKNLINKAKGKIKGNENTLIQNSKVRGE